MKNLLSIILVLFITTGANAQFQTDVIYLKNGSVIKCRVLEEVFGVSVKIKTFDGSVYVYKADEVSQIKRETSELPAEELSTYGGTVGLGIAIAGGGIIGMPLRFNLSGHFAFETSASLRPTMIQQTTYGGWGYEETTTEWTFPVMITAGFDIFGKPKYVPVKNKIIKNGFLIRGGVTTSVDNQQTMAVIGWTRERFKFFHKKNSYIFSLGAGILHFDNSSILSESLNEDVEIMPMLYLKFHWNWYFKSEKQKD